MRVEKALADALDIQLTEESDTGTVVVQLRGRIGSLESARLGQVLRPYGTGAFGSVLIDFDGVDAMSSEALGGLIYLHGVFEKVGVRLQLVDARPAIRSLLADYSLEWLTLNGGTGHREL
jgi:anti-anti-sigma regulatory factor